MSAVLTAPAPERAATTRPPRDLYVDGIRAVGILAVVALHWLMVEAAWDGQRLQIGNALGHGWAWLLTWLNPLPMLFYAAGVAARHGWSRHGSARGFVRGRVRAMLPALGCFVAIWAALMILLPVLGVPEVAVHQAARIAPQPLWFLGVQVLLLAATPWLVRVGERWGWRLPVIVGAAALAVDVLRFGAGIDQVAMMNLLLVWSVPYTIGMLETSGRMRGLEVRAGRAALVAGTALAATVGLLAAGPYPISLIGMPGDAVSNLAPPTAPVLTFAVAQVAAVVALRPVLTEHVARWGWVRWVGAHSMGLYLWHLTAMFLLTGVLIFGLGLAVPEPWTGTWWVTRPVIALLAWGLLLVMITLASRTQPVITRAIQAWS